MKITLTSLAALILVTSLVACGGGDDDSDATAAPTTSDSGGAGVGATPPPSDSGLPSGADENFPVAIPDGWVIDVNGSIGLVVTNSIQVLYPLDQFDALVSFYDQWTAEQDAEYSKIEGDDTIVFQRASPLQQISVGNDYERGGDQYAVLQISVAGGRSAN